MIGNRKKAYILCEKALFQILINDLDKIQISIEQDVSEKMSYNHWKKIIAEILIKLPEATEQTIKWINKTKAILQEIANTYKLKFLHDKPITEIIKIKSYDREHKNFKEIPIKEFFEIKSHKDCTFSSVHGVKGESYDALLLLVKHNQGGNTLTPSFLCTGNTNKELMRIAYVAMTRPRKLLVIAMPRTEVKLNDRFPKEKWDYVDL